MQRRKLKIKAKGLQIGAAFGITNQGKKITNRGRDYKSVQNIPKQSCLNSKKLNIVPFVLMTNDKPVIA